MINGGNGAVMYISNRKYLCDYVTSQTLGGYTGVYLAWEGQGLPYLELTAMVEG